MIEEKNKERVTQLFATKNKFASQHLKINTKIFLFKNILAIDRIFEKSYIFKLKLSFNRHALKI